MMNNDTPPVIIGDFDERDASVDVLYTLHDNVSFTRGLGDSGYRLALVEGPDCPVCGYDRLCREHRVKPDSTDHVKYYCTNPGCSNFCRDNFSHIRGMNPAHQPPGYGHDPRRDHE